MGHRGVCTGTAQPFCDGQKTARAGLEGVVDGGGDWVMDRVVGEDW